MIFTLESDCQLSWGHVKHRLQVCLGPRTQQRSWPLMWKVMLVTLPSYIHNGNILHCSSCNPFIRFERNQLYAVAVWKLPCAAQRRLANFSSRLHIVRKSLDPGWFWWWGDGSVGLWRPTHHPPLRPLSPSFQYPSFYPFLLMRNQIYIRPPPPR